MERDFAVLPDLIGGKTLNFLLSKLYCSISTAAFTERGEKSLSFSKIQTVVTPLSTKEELLKIGSKTSIHESGLLKVDTYIGIKDTSRVQ